MLSLSGIAVALALFVAPNTDRADCTNAAGRYSAAANLVLEALRAYGKCIGTSAGSTDCASQMRALDDAHDTFADAVAAMKACQ